MVWVRKQPGVGANKQAPNGSKKQDNQASNWEQDSEIEHMARPIDPNDLKPVTSHRKMRRNHPTGFTDSSNTETLWGPIYLPGLWPLKVPSIKLANFLDHKAVVVTDNISGMTISPLMSQQSIISSIGSDDEDSAIAAHARAKHRISILEDELNTLQSVLMKIYWIQCPQNRYQQMMIYLPFMKCKLVECDIQQLDELYKDLRKGANNARGDNASNLKYALVSWLIGMYHPLEQPLNTSTKDNRGFENRTTGSLLCPIDYDWSDNVVQKNVRECHRDFLVTADSWPTFLYESPSEYNQEDPDCGLFQSSLLLKTFKLIFTSPSSAQEDNRLASVPWDRPHHGEKSTSNVLDWFEGPGNVTHQKHVKELLLWWDGQVFGKI
ncbi:hypothetical protein SERLADRAFT_404788 [Serpula lacrymans var. lacrymans S7.9]|uniref:Uncharacterized protein n=1 Tax=Serpula lacrymans var. lacrymans (strain S7.9) TaxID=578457 RepID=F8NF02_SERL9|nr:uncharacterized protein SERLADRAFT_404788 [Serpula lacrymans var. lacrymans S7.9]EGO30761.1 hypothetical protein SERLADRAFT_404788 [Serpula lacrymans var. lacrymans S7.9]